MSRTLVKTNERLLRVLISIALPIEKYSNIIFCLQKAAADNIRRTTKTALDVLNIAQDAVDEEKSRPYANKQNTPSIIVDDSHITVTKRKSDNNGNNGANEEVELRLTFDEFEKLYEAGKISRAQIRSGKVSRSQLMDIQRWLEDHRPHGFELEPEHSVDANGLPVSIDCGLKRVDSKRYKRDYVIGAKKPAEKKWDVKTKQNVAPEIVKPMSPTGRLNQTEEDVCI